MPTIAFVVPVLPGKEDADREGMEQLTAGADAEAYMASRRAQGFQREAVWHQETPDGTVAIVMWEVEDPERAFGAIATSEEPLDRRFREFLKDVHGIDVASDPPPNVRPVSDTRF